MTGILSASLLFVSPFDLFETFFAEGWPEISPETSATCDSFFYSPCFFFLAVFAIRFCFLLVGCVADSGFPVTHTEVVTASIRKNSPFLLRFCCTPFASTTH